MKLIFTKQSEEDILAEFDPALYATFLNVVNRCAEKKDTFKCYDKKLIRGLGSKRMYHLVSPCSLNDVLIKGGYCAENSWSRFTERKKD
ncbi:MAG: hypothetical protein V1739_01620 [Candidatus Omnitrophota bacterium]